MRHFFFLLLLISPIFLCAQDQDFEHTKNYDDRLGSPDALLEDVAWIAGHWRGEAMGAMTEEIWSPPLGGSMMGSFKLAGPDSVVFYELMHIQQQGQTLLLQIRHFSGNFFAWEDKEETVDFRLVEITENKVVFDGLTFRRISDEEMIVYVQIGEGNEVSEVGFEYRLYQPE